MSIHDVRFQLLDLPQQEVLVELQGPTLLHLRKGLLDDPAAVESLPDLSDLARGEPEDTPPLVDVIELFLRGMDVGLMGVAARGRLVSESLDEARQLKRWQLSLAHMYPGAFRVLRNLLRALEPERGVLQTLKGLTGGRLLGAPAGLDYPPHASPLPFPVEASPELGDRELRSVRLTFRQPVGEQREPEVLAAFDAWAHLLMLGAYLEDADAEEGRLGAAPEPPGLADPHTVEMSFEVFNSGSAALDAAVNLAHFLHQTKGPVESLELD